MLKIGLTGGIGSGKSFVCNLFAQLGIPIYNSDERGKYLMANSHEVKEAILNLLGKEAYKDGALNRNHIASVVFNDPKLLNKLNNIVHPAVFKDFNHWCSIQEKENPAFILKEAAILFESGAYKKLDKIILITAPEHVRIERVMERDGISEDAVRNRIKNQTPTEDLIPLTDFIIRNDDKELILPQIICIYNKLVKNGKIR